MQKKINVISVEDKRHSSRDKSKGFSKYPNDKQKTELRKGLRITGLVKEFDKSEKFGGAYDDKMERTIHQYKKLMKMWKIPLDKKIQ